MDTVSSNQEHPETFEATSTIGALGRVLAQGIHRISLSQRLNSDQEDTYKTALVPAAQPLDQSIELRLSVHNGLRFEPRELEDG